MTFFSLASSYYACYYGSNMVTFLALLIIFIVCHPLKIPLCKCRISIWYIFFTLYSKLNSTVQMWNFYAIIFFVLLFTPFFMSRLVHHGSKSSMYQRTSTICALLSSLNFIALTKLHPEIFHTTVAKQPLNALFLNGKLVHIHRYFSFLVAISWYVI